MEKPFEYNDEFFLDEEARKRARAEFAPIWFALHSDEIVSTFRGLDEEAKRLKSGFQKWGLGVVILAVLALSIAAIEPAYIHPLVDKNLLPKSASLYAGAAAAIAGLISIVMGYFGMGIGQRRRQWLRTRLLCERIRQWRWQYYCARIPEALDAVGNAEKQRRYEAARDAAFKSFIAELRAGSDAAVEHVLTEEAKASSNVWLGDLGAAFHAPALAAALDSAGKEGHARQIIVAYDRIRVGGQRRYADYLVTKKGPFKTHPATQQALLHKASTTLIFAILALHVILLVGAFRFHEAETLFKLSHVSAVVLALTALGIRAIEDGLRPAEHLGRFKGYLDEVVSIGRSLTDATSGRERQNVMIALETAAYTEMVDFIRTGQRSQYVM